MRVAVCHEWTTCYGGSEQVASRLASILGASDIFTFAAEPNLAARLFPGRAVHALSKRGRDHWRMMLPAMPHAWASLDLSDYDLVVTSSHSCVNSIRVRSDAIHLSYCHTPMRYAWEWRSELGRIPAAVRPALPVISAALRSEDRSRSRNVHEFIANSCHVKRRIQSAYDRDASVVYPPIDTSFWTPARVAREPFFLLAGRLVAYKRPEVAVAAAMASNVDLIVAGAGPALNRLRSIANDRIRFVENPTREALRDLYRTCRALLNPGVEDFGMTMAEAQACGAPVIALRAGGAQEIVDDGVTGILYEDRSSDSLAAIMRRSDVEFDSVQISSRAQRFCLARFDAEITRVIDRLTCKQWVGASA
ncbi:MAG: glycosyltransferase [Actinomycetota bacterium]